MNRENSNKETIIKNINEMDNLDKILIKARGESNKFFSNFDNDKANKKVLLNLDKKSKTFNRKKYAIYFPALGITPLAASFILLFLIFTNKGGYNTEIAESSGTPVSQQLIKLNDYSQLVNFFKISKPDQSDNNMLAVIWESDRNGDYAVVYNSMFENTSVPLPVEIISFPSQQPPLVILSSQNDEKNYIHYRILGYKNDEIFSFMEQNYVDGGMIEVDDGILKETRSVPNSFNNKENNNDMNQIVTYFIPYQSDKAGDINIPADYLKISKGEYIAVLGDGIVPIEIMQSELLADWDTEFSLSNANQNLIILYAEKPGQEYLYFKPVNGNTAKKILLEVVE